MSETIYTVTFVTVLFDAYPSITVQPCRTKELAEKLSIKQYKEINQFIQQKRDELTGFICLDPDKTFFAQFEGKEMRTMYSIIQAGTIYEEKSDSKKKQLSFMQQILTRKNK